MSRDLLFLNQPAAGLPCRHVWGATDLVDKMMSDTASLTRRNFCRTDIQLLVDLKRVASDDLTFELTRDTDPEITLARSGRPDNGYQALHCKSSVRRAGRG
mgnify:CR=1 FL=1